MGSSHADPMNLIRVIPAQGVEVPRASQNLTSGGRAMNDLKNPKASAAFYADPTQQEIP